jgi:MFS transporter, PAT family, beta-lactamase induction signal transducer AmpG
MLQTIETSHSDKKANRSTFPSLSEHTFLRYLSFSVLYVAQGIPEGMTFFGIPAWMAMNGKSVTEIGGFVAVVGIPWSLKILIAPLMDRFTFLAMGRRRPWVLVGQLGLIISFIAMAFVPDPLNNINLLMVAGFLISFFGAFQDVAVDGMAIDIVPIDQQARANGLMWGAKTIGISASLAAGNWIIHKYCFEYAVLCLASIISIIILMPLFLRERPGEKILPWSRGSASAINLTMQLESWGQIFKSLVKVFFLPGSLLMGSAFFIIQMGFGLIHTLLPVFTIQAVGWTDQEYAHVFSITSIVAGFLGMLAGGALADLFGKKRMITIYLICMILLVAAMAFFRIYWSNAFLVTGFISTYITLWVFLSVAVFATGMELCWKRVAATQFTLYMAISNLGKAVGSGLLGPLHKVMDWEYVILSFAGFAIVMLVLVQFLRLNKHLDRIEILEQDHLENEAVLLPILLPIAEVK